MQHEVLLKHSICSRQGGPMVCPLCYKTYLVALRGARHFVDAD